MPEEVQMHKNPPSLEKLSRDLYMASNTAGFIHEKSLELNKNENDHNSSPFQSLDLQAGSLLG